MRRSLARVEEWTLEPTGRPAFRLRCRPSARPVAGQAALATLPGSAEPLRRTLFPSLLDTESIITDCPPDPAWPPGTWLDLLSPVGRGFKPSSAARRWLLIGLTPDVARLLPLVAAGLGQKASVVLVTPSPPPGLAAEVEVIPLAEPAIAWADYIAVDAPGESVMALGDLFAGGAHERRSIAEVLVARPLPCGTGVCVACAVPATRGWKLACIDGPVFRAEELLR